MTTPDVWMRSDGWFDCARPRARRMRASTSAGPASTSTTSSTPQSGVTAVRPPSVTMRTSGDGQAGGAQDLRERLRAGEVGARVEEDEIGFGRSDQLLRRCGDDPHAVSQE
jgi:hypothetical protein